MYLEPSGLKLLTPAPPDWRERLDISEQIKLEDYMFGISALLTCRTAQKFAEQGKCECGNIIKPITTVSERFGTIRLLPKECEACLTKYESEYQREQEIENFKSRNQKCCGYQNRQAAHQGKVIDWGDIQDGYEFQKQIFNYIKLFLKGKRKSAYIYGASGTGKTYLSKILHNSLLSDFQDSCYIRAVDLAITLRKECFGENYKTVLKDFQTVPLLVIDDFGTQKNTEWVSETLFAILDYRYTQHLPVVFTSNIPPMELGQPRLSSRIMDRKWCDTVNLQGNDLRFKN